MMPCPCESDKDHKECHKKLFVSVNQLIHHIQKKKGNHLGWVRFAMGIHGDKDVLFDDIKRAITVRVLPEWLRYVLKPGDRFQVPRCFTPAVSGKIIRQHWYPRHDKTHAEMRVLANASSLKDGTNSRAVFTPDGLRQGRS